MDTYQPIFDAVRSKLSNANVGLAVEAVLREANISHYIAMATDATQCAAYEHQRPSAVFRPKLSIDGNKWCALYGTDLQDGCAGFGNSPSTAMENFDREWSKKLEHRNA